MRKLLNNPKVVVVLALAAVLAVGYSLLSEKRAPLGVQPAPEAVAAVESLSENLVSPDNTTASSLAPLEALAALIGKATPRDPFAPTAVAAVAAVAESAEQPDSVETIHLSAVWTQRDTTLLLINGRMMRAGESVGRIVIDSVTREGVWLRHWKGRDFLTVGQRFELKTPARMLASVAAP